MIKAFLIVALIGCVACAVQAKPATAGFGFGGAPTLAPATGSGR